MKPCESGSCGGHGHGGRKLKKQPKGRAHYSRRQHPKDDGCEEECQKWSCGSTYYCWKKCGKKFRSRLVSAPDAEAQEASIEEAASALEALYAGPLAAITPAKILALGLFDELSTIVRFPVAPLPTDPVTLVGSVNIATAISGALVLLKSNFPASTLSVDFDFQFLNNETLSLTVVITTTTVAGVFTSTLVLLSKVVNCGCDVPVVVSGTWTSTSPLP